MAPRNVTPSACSDVVLGAGHAGIAPETVMQVFKKCAEHKMSGTKALIGCDGKTWTWKQYYDDSMVAAKGFIALGVGRFESVSILGFNSPEWLLSNMGAIAAGGFAAGIYTTNEPPACKFIAEHCSARVIVVDGTKQLDKILAVAHELPKLVAIVVYGPDGVKAGVNDGKGEGEAKVYSWDQFMALGADVPDATVAARIADQKAGHCCTLIYTSGTTGNPKAVMISHDNAIFTTRANIAHHPDFVNGALRVVSFLPLSHIAAQIVDIHSPMCYLADHGLPSEIHFAKPDALRGSLKETLLKAKPTVFFAVPRVWEKFAEALQAVGKKSTGVKKMIATWGKGLGKQIHKASQVGATTTHPIMGFLAKKLVFAKVKGAIGLDETRLCITGAAPITLDTLNYFGSIGIHIVEVYGMSENSGPQNSGQNGYFQAGSCGRQMPGVETKIDHLASRDKPGEGEVCFRGRHVMMGYMNSPEKTAESIDEDGWLHSGDVGRIDDVTKMLRITGRIKELIITAGGENIAPVPIEDRLKSLLPAVSNVMMVGDKKKYNTLLVTLRQKPDDNDGFTNDLFGASLELSPASATVTAAKADPKWKAYVEAGLVAYNKEAMSNAQKIQKFIILDVDFSVAGGELTSTQKLKRNVVMEKCVKVIDAMYAGGGAD
eukprot:CAMPEP_0197602944 /NCGR_PEP_ID=MMETSP1326-20131121/38221_1 /TAXON_ID=1155430 /ORGANISM="Genus nov. species nov., Strain RCC2288" /LENGTH=658 /DNA_ID=CAMNT_0043170385 /DNA_START=73 /DNA_END=2049 /DNA_ORIENTATION=-